MPHGVSVYFPALQSESVPRPPQWGGCKAPRAPQGTQIAKGMPRTICYSSSHAEEFRCALSDTLELQTLLVALTAWSYLVFPLLCYSAWSFIHHTDTVTPLISHRDQWLLNFKLWRKTQSPFMLKQTVARLEVMNVSICPGEMDDRSGLLTLLLVQGQLIQCSGKHPWQNIS